MKRRNFIFGLSGLLSFFGLNKFVSFAKADLFNELPAEKTNNTIKLWYNKNELRNRIERALESNFKKGLISDRNYDIWNVEYICSHIILFNEDFDNDNLHMLECYIETAISVGLMRDMNKKGITRFGSIDILYDDSRKDHKYLTFEVAAQK